MGTHYRRDYQAPAFEIPKVDLRVVLEETYAEVTSTLQIVPKEPAVLSLQGEHLRCLWVALNERILEPQEYEVLEHGLRLTAPLEAPCTLQICTRCEPKKNTALSGLYYSGRLYCTQCEPEGFRRITYYLDRPDVLSIFRTTIVADKAAYPYLLSNGNRIAAGDFSDGRHWVQWEDPFPKPCYLFALVAGDLVQISDSFVTRSGRTVALEFYVAAEDAHQVGHAVVSLKKAMAWDEKTYGLEYDLDLYMVVAVSDFNMGAMENKGLNIFNTKYVLAHERTATDRDYHDVEAVIGHEYFHNWSGNRVTCRDWFQLSLKEGFTVFREHQFSSEASQSALQRIDEVNLMRTRQFAEDSGPMAHPVRPDSYQEINNFYTATVYNKGAEVIRMLKILVGEAAFYQGVSTYFKRHDGQAVTCDDFVAAICSAAPVEFKGERFKRWYAQAGTPCIEFQAHYDPLRQVFRLHARQSCPPTPGQPQKEPFLIPLEMALFDYKGHLLSEQLLVLEESEHTFEWKNISSAPIPSLGRGFSAPVNIQYPYTFEERLVLLAHETDPVNRWDAAQQLLTLLLLEPKPEQHSALAEALGAVLRSAEQPGADLSVIAAMLSVPSLAYLSTRQRPIQIECWAKNRRTLESELACRLEPTFRQCYEHLREEVQPTAGKRALQNTCLYYLMRAGVPLEPLYASYLAEQYQTAANMTLKIGALKALRDITSPFARDLFEDFYHTYQHQALVVDKWLLLQAQADLEPALVLARVRQLLEHPAFVITNPNKVYALIGGLTANLPVFHMAGGEGYAFLEMMIHRLDALNPQVAARMAQAFTAMVHYDASRQALMRAAMERLLAQDLSADVGELLEKTLG